MLRLINPNDVLSMCYTFIDIFNLIAMFVREVLAIFGVEFPDLRQSCVQLFNFLSA